VSWGGSGGGGDDDEPSHARRTSHVAWRRRQARAHGHFPSFYTNSTSHHHTSPSDITMADKLRAQQQLEALQARYIGIGSGDTTKHEWASNMARDSLSSYIGHPPLLQYMSIGLGQPREKTRVQLLERMVRPVGPPPEVSASDVQVARMCMS
jgi:splicing factor 3B subunit 5